MTGSRLRGKVAALGAPRRLAALRKSSPRTAETIKQVMDRRLTYLELPALLDLAEAMLDAERSGRRGAVIEAGTAYGGSALVLAAAKSPDRPLVLYDAFGAFPPPGARDAEDAHTRHAVIAAGAATWDDDRPFYSYVDDLLGEVTRSFVELGLDPGANRVSFVPGLIEETLVVDGPVALAHVDCDWFEPVHACLTRVAPHLERGARLVIDDYDAWEGAQRAVDEYVAGHRELELRRRSRVHVVRRG